MTSAEFSLWTAYAELEPFGFPWQRYCMAVPTTVIGNEVRASVPRVKGTQVKWLKAEDLYPGGEAKGMPTDLTPAQRAFIERRKAQRKAAKTKGK
jgi:hypothetical protein